MARLALLLLLAGCPGAETKKYETVSHLTASTLVNHGVSGGEASAAIAYRGFGVFADLEGLAVTRTRLGDPNRHPGGGFDIGLRLSLFGLFNTSGDHRVEHWFDLGGAFGAGAGVTHTAQLGTYGHAWVGAWTEFGILPGTKYLALVGEIRDVSYGDPYDDQVVITIGLSYVSRVIDTYSNLHD